MWRSSGCGREGGGLKDRHGLRQGDHGKARAVIGLILDRMGHDVQRELPCCAFAGQACPADPSVWSVPAWLAFPFAIDTAHHYNYSTTTASGGAALVATAAGDLDCDAVVSVFVLSCTVVGGAPSCSLQVPAVID